VFDFTGTTPEVYGNCNAPRAVTLSAIIYCLRCMVGHDVPLNQVFSSHCLICFSVVTVEIHTFKPIFLSGKCWFQRNYTTSGYALYNYIPSSNSSL